jgi:hypothetical protein
MPFRDEIAAAHERIAQLEEENARLREELAGRERPRKRLDAQLFATLGGFLVVGGVGVAFAAAAVSRHASREAVAAPAQMQAQPAGLSYESALATIALDPPGARRLSDDELREPFARAAIGETCGAGSARVRIAVRDGAAVGVSVFTTPRDPMVAECIDRAMRTLTWPRTLALSTITTSL